MSTCVLHLRIWLCSHQHMEYNYENKWSDMTSECNSSLLAKMSILIILICQIDQLERESSYIIKKTRPIIHDQLYSCGMLGRFCDHPKAWFCKQCHSGNPSSRQLLSTGKTPPAGPSLLRMWWLKDPAHSTLSRSLSLLAVPMAGKRKDLSTMVALPLCVCEGRAALWF